MTEFPVALGTHFVYFGTRRAVIFTETDDHEVNLTEELKEGDIEGGKIEIKKADEMTTQTHQNPSKFTRGKITGTHTAEILAFPLLLRPQQSLFHPGWVRWGWKGGLS